MYSRMDFLLLINFKKTKTNGNCIFENTGTMHQVYFFKYKFISSCINIFLRLNIGLLPCKEGLGHSNSAGDEADVSRLILHMERTAKHVV